MSLTMTFKGRCTDGQGPNLSRYPNLAHTADRGVFTHLTGTAVEAIAGHARESGLIAAIETACIDAHATFDELLDALRYARAQGLV